jgi:two-component sensor histidine kinase
MGSVLLLWPALAASLPGPAALQVDYFHLGIYLISTFVGLALFLGGGRHRAFLLFAIYSFLLALYWAVNPVIDRFHLGLQFAQVLFGFRQIVFLISGVLLNVFFIVHFEFPRKAVLLSVAVALPALIEAAGVRFWLGLEWRDTATALYSLGLLAWATKRRRVGSLVSLLGMMGLAWPVVYPNLARALRFLPKLEGRLVPDLSLLFIPAIILSISRHVREQSRLLEAARSRSHRLETELLKSRIQPHYICNTLHSIKSWFRENPERADKMIQALSDEFKIINAYSAKALIPLAEEIRLCRNHLEIMGSRRDVRFELDADGLPPDETIPPLVLHTLIENGITHAYGPRESGRFRLRVSVDGRNVVYRLSNGGSRLREWAEKGPDEIGEGMGMAYIQARLEESFPGRWRVDYGLKGETWEVTIRIRK